MENFELMMGLGILTDLPKEVKMGNHELEKRKAIFHHRRRKRKKDARKKMKKNKDGS